MKQLLSFDEIVDKITLQLFREKVKNIILNDDECRALLSGSHTVPDEVRE